MSTSSEVAGILSAAGFAPSRYRNAFERATGIGKWMIRASVSDDAQEPDRIELALLEPGDPAFTVGTHFRVTSTEVLRRELDAIIAKLTELAASETSLKCPLCKTRWVRLKEYSGGPKPFAPFLSCAGMTVVGRGAQKRIACKGVSNIIPALVELG
jgi:hypothetical protein